MRVMHWEADAQREPKVIQPMRLREKENIGQEDRHVSIVD